MHLRRILVTLASFASLLDLSPKPGLAQSSVGIPHGPYDGATCGSCGFSQACAGCQDKADFSTASFSTSFGQWYYYSGQNNNIEVNVRGSGGLWQWNPSKVAVHMGVNETVAVGVVLASTTADFYNPATAANYKRVMYFTYQAFQDAAAGRVCLTYSNSDTDANDWTTPIAAVLSGSGTTRGLPCTQANATVLAESISGFRRTASEIDLFRLDGNITTLLNDATSGKTDTYLVKATAGAGGSPDVLVPNLDASHKEKPVTSLGVYSPIKAGSGGGKDYYFRNLDASYDPANGRVYLARVTPYPYSPTGTPFIPCDAPPSEMCPRGGIATFPLRGQIYYMKVDTNVAKVLDPTQTLIFDIDLGSNKGWASLASGSCADTTLVESKQKDYGLDLDSLSFYKTTSGFVSRDAMNGLLNLLGGGWSPLFVPGGRKGDCRTAGTVQGTWFDAELYEFVAGS
jgi:hypothetical protein